MEKNYSKIILLSLLMLFFGFTGNLIAQNLLINGDFETGDLTGWNIQKDSVAATAETSTVHGGATAAKLVMTGNKTDTDFGQQQVFIADSGTSYDFSVWAYHTEGHIFFAWVIGYGPGAYTFSSSNAMHTDNTITNEWQEFTWHWDCTHTDTVDVFYRFYQQAGWDGEEIVYIDDAVVQVAVAGVDATVSDLTIEGGTVADFDPGVYHYDVLLPEGTEDIPVVDAAATDENASVVVTQATDLMGDETARTATVIVTAADGTTTQSYTITFSVVTGITTSGANRLNLYPNPARDEIVLSGLNAGRVSKVNIMDVTGRIVKTMDTNGTELRLGISDLHPGCYFVRVENKTLKFIKR